MAKTRKAAYEVQTVNTARPVEKALFRQRLVSRVGDFSTGTDGWFGWELPVVAAASWGLAWLGVVVVGWLSCPGAW